jgi:glycosyltransferase involved in cell wall biosynthesis
MNNLADKKISTQKPVLFLSDDMELGGATIFVLNICEALREVGSQWQGFSGILTNYGAIGEQILSRKLPSLGPFSGRLLHEDYVERMHQECRTLQPTAVVANLGGGAFDFLRFVPDSTLRIAMIHSDDECVYQGIERYLPWIDLIVGVSLHNCEAIRKRIFNRNVLIKHVACGVPMINNNQREIRKEGLLRVLYIGRVVEEQKRASLLLKVIQQSLKLGLPVTWTIAGDGPDLKMMRKALIENQDRVRFLGSVEYAQVPALLTEYDIYFLCSDYEGLPLSMLEAMGAGCVPVVSDLQSGIPEVVNETSGIRVPISEPDAYVAALARLSSDRSRLAEMSKNAMQSVTQEYSTSAMGRRWNKVLEEHQKPTKPDWSKPCKADAPPQIRKRLRFHPLLRPIRRLAKIACG